MPDNLCVKKKDEDGCVHPIILLCLSSLAFFSSSGFSLAEWMEKRNNNIIPKHYEKGRHSRHSRTNTHSPPIYFLFFSFALTFYVSLRFVRIILLRFAPKDRLSPEKMGIFRMSIFFIGWILSSIFTGWWYSWFYYTLHICEKIGKKMNPSFFIFYCVKAISM